MPVVGSLFKFSEIVASVVQAVQWFVNFLDIISSSLVNCFIQFYTIYSVKRKYISFICLRGSVMLIKWLS